MIRYAFLWKEDYDEGRYEDSKDRPCAIVVATRMKETAAIQVVVVPITHAPPGPKERSASLEIPSRIAKTLGLDGERHWVRLTQLNRFIWPGYDLRPRTDDPGRIDYGLIPEAFFDEIKAAILAEDRRKKLFLTPRDA